jgi:predicted lysophospholipase L1 biosynthesis ABC-type transport system permease subunit
VLLAKASIGQAARTVVLLAHPITPQRRLQQIQPQKWFSKQQKKQLPKKTVSLSTN